MVPHLAYFSGFVCLFVLAFRRHKMAVDFDGFVNSMLLFAAARANRNLNLVMDSNKFQLHFYF